jgi:hypothetical protein
MAVNMDKLNVFVGQFVGDLGAAVHSGMVVIVSRFASTLASRRPKSFRAGTTTWLPCSIVSTTWVIR